MADKKLEKQIENQLEEKLVGAINAIAKKDYKKLLDFINLEKSKYIKGKNEIESIKEYGKMLDAKIMSTVKDDDRFPNSNSLKIDKFDIEYLEEGFDEIAEELIYDGSSFCSYCLCSGGEYIDYMDMEFKIEMNKSKKITIYWSFNN